MNFLKQTIAVTMLNLRTIPQRLGSSGVAIVGIAGVVIVLVSVLSIAQGFAYAMEASGSPVRALVMRSGADSEMTSGLSGGEVDLIKQAPGLRRDGQTPMASGEMYVIIDIPKISTNTSANVPMRGIEPPGTALREEFSIAEGRMFNFGTNEVIVGPDQATRPTPMPTPAFSAVRRELPADSTFVPATSSLMTPPLRDGDERPRRPSRHRRARRQRRA